MAIRNPIQDLIATCDIVQRGVMNHHPASLERDWGRWIQLVEVMKFCPVALGSAGLRFPSKARHAETPRPLFFLG